MSIFLLLVFFLCEVVSRCGEIRWLFFSFRIRIELLLLWYLRRANSFRSHCVKCCRCHLTFICKQLIRSMEKLIRPNNSMANGNVTKVVEDKLPTKARRTLAMAAHLNFRFGHYTQFNHSQWLHSRRMRLPPPLEWYVRLHRVYGFKLKIVFVTEWYKRELGIRYGRIFFAISSVRGTADGQ